MDCRRCGGALAPGTNFCHHCGAERVVYCVECGTSLPARADSCTLCRRPQPGAERKTDTAARYNHPQHLFNIAVPPPWEVAERSIAGAQFVVIDRPDVRSGGLRGLMENVLSIGPAGLQIWLLPLPPASDLAALDRAYVAMQSKLSAPAGAPALAATPVNRHEFQCGDAPGAALDFRHSVLGLSETVERRFLTLLQRPDVALGVVMVESAPPREFSAWERAVWGIASSLRFGPASASTSSSAAVNHLPALRVGAVDAALDWVWLFDNGQGDFAAARAAAELALSERRDADTLVARAVVHQLQGEFGAALALLEEALAAAPDDGRRFLVTSLACLVERRRGDVLPDGDSVDFVEAVRLWGARGSPTEWERRFQAAYRRPVAPHELLAGNYLAYVLSMAATMRNLLWTTGERLRVEELDNFTQQLTGWAQQASQAGEGWLVRALAGLQAELRAAAGQTAEALNMLGHIARAHREAGDTAGAAWCAISRGDMLAAPPPLGRPQLFGYVIKEQTTNTTGRADPPLFDRSRIDIEGARAAYEEARGLYESAAARRGVAAALLRLAYLDALDDGRGWAHAARGYSEAEAVFVEAGDQTGRWLARAGQLWARLGAGEGGLAVAARPLAEEMKAASALTWGLSVGLALARAGREALGVRGDVEQAARAARLAEVFFEVFDAPLKRAQVCNDRADAWNTLEVTEDAVLEWDAALGWLEQAARRQQSDDHAIKLAGMQSAYNLVNLYSTARDVEGMERALARARALSEGVPEISHEQFMRLKEAALGPPGAAQGGPAPDAATLLALYADRMPAFQEFYAKFQPYMIHTLMRLIGEQAAVFIPLSRGVSEFARAREESAARFFEEALRAADGSIERDFQRAMVFASWRKRDEARDALGRYVAAGLPQSSDAMGEIQLAVAPNINAESAEEVRRRNQASVRRNVAALLVTVEAWADARVQYEEVERLRGGPPRLSLPVPAADEITMLANYALVADGLGEAERALGHMSEAVEGLETRRRYLRQERVRRAFGGQRFAMGLYADHARLLAARGRWEQAFMVADMARARVLAESVGGARAAAEQLQMAEAYRRYTEQAAAVERLTTQLAAARNAETGDAAYVERLVRQLGEAAEELDAREEALSRAAPQWRELSAPRADVLSVAEVAARLPPGALLLAYIMFDKYLITWAVTRAGLVEHGVLDEFDGQPLHARQLAARARAWAGVVSGRGEDESEGTTLSPTFEAALAGALLGRHDAEIEAAEHLLLVPFAELNTLPFQALPWRGLALGLQKPISYLPAASLLQYFRQPEPRAAGALVVGDPASMSYADAASGRVETLDPLPAARLEARAVAAFYGARPLVGELATEQAVRDALKESPRLIHFATHGLLQEGAPLASGVALAGGEAITVDELMGFDLKADVVALSACDTGRGRLQGGELVGLARGLLYAGARSVVVSLWPVEDVATAMLMEFFHEELSVHGGPARALWRAQIRLRQTTAKEAGPYFACAADAYAEAVAALKESGRGGAAERLGVKLDDVKLRAEMGDLSPASRPFEEARDWSAFQVIGDWR